MADGAGVSSPGSSSEDEEMMMALLSAAATVVSSEQESRRGGSEVGRSGNRDRGRESGAVRIDLDYFCRKNIGPPTFNDVEFQRRFRVSRNIYEQVRSKVCLLYTSPSPRDGLLSRMPSSA